MDQALLQLAFAMHRNPGLYALLIGSGVSRAAEIPTGWMVILDLIRQIMETMGEEAGDPVKWYRSTFDEEPTYSAILERLAPTPPERNGLLRPYFEPTDEEREEGIKLPTAAHKSIAWLVKRGYVKVILTTNFDRLLEIALEAEGITPNVYRSDDDFASMAPIQHSEVVIIKLHGDYRDWRIKNSADELAEYSQPLQDLLKRIFQEYGLIIGGWSGEYDTALCTSLLQPLNPRMPTYGLYWLAYKGNTTEMAQSLTHQRNAQIVSIKDANKFFSDLQNTVEALENATKDKSLPISILVERVKKYLKHHEYNIDLEDLLREEIDLAYQEFTSDSFIQRVYDTETPLDKWSIYFQPVERVLNILAVLSWYGRETEHTRLIQDTIEQLLFRTHSGNFYQLVPALLAMYVIGIPAIHRQKWLFLATALEKTRTIDPQNGEVGSSLTTCFNSLVRRTHNVEINQGNKTLAAESYVEQLLRPQLAKILGSFFTQPTRFEQAFDIFEMMQCLVYLKQNPDKDWLPFHQAIVRSDAFLIDYWQSAPANWGFTSTVFDNSSGLLKSTLERYRKISELICQRRVVNGILDYAEIYSESPNAKSGNPSAGSTRYA